MRSARFGIGLLLLCALASVAAAQELKLKREMKLKKVMPSQLAFSPDGRYMAVAGGKGDFRWETKRGQLSVEKTDMRETVLLLDTSSLEVKRELIKGTELQFGPGLGMPVTSSAQARAAVHFLRLVAWVGEGNSRMAFSADGRRLLVHYRGAICVYDVEGGRLVAKWGENLSDVRFSADRRVALAVRKDGEGRKYEMLDLASGQSLGSFSGVTSAKIVAEFLPLDPERPLLVFVKDHNLVLRNLKTGTETLLGALEGQRLTGVAASPDGKLLAVGSARLSVWSIPENKKLFEGPRSDEIIPDPVFSPDGALLAYGSGESICLCSVARAQCTVQTVVAEEVAFADAQTLATYDSAKSVISLWSFSIPAGAESGGVPATSGGKSQSFTVDRAGNLVTGGSPPQPVPKSAAAWRWKLEGVRRLTTVIEGMSPGPELRVGHVYLDLALSLENNSGQVQEITFPVPDLFLWRRSRGQEIEPRDFATEKSRENIAKFRKEGHFQNLSPDVKFTLTIEVAAGNEKQVSILFEVPEDVPLDDLELHFPDATKLSLSGGP